ncbi:dihydrofolate reductase family protein [Psychromicrobium lacuslunae]|uniref:Bacterial bifunctional deaminase-reductase C-terminal domain-containing protein n=1 Tax=Psychromicrobium lacuslunae TaxID=1618207 RepID=A0A0D4C1G6_9MICC|nr:dihydrofolate reductase family protein [Psychromicrobium lacuslunae]AJT42443.1 hypothetical protein UM93_14765 [Psychromicrobium lacuslunae]
MGTLTTAMFMTLDGMTETPEGAMIAPAWSADMEKYWSGSNAREGQMLLYGSKAFEFNAQFWQEAAENPKNPEEHRRFARTMNALPKVVFSSSLSEVGWNAKVESRPVAEAVPQIKAEFDGEIVAVGGISIVSSLIEARLVDTYRFLLTPQIAGAGRSIFDQINTTTKLELISSQTLDTGSVLLNYQPSAS